MAKFANQQQYPKSSTLVEEALKKETFESLNLNNCWSKTNLADSNAAPTCVFLSTDFTLYLYGSSSSFIKAKKKKPEMPYSTYKAIVKYSMK